MTDKKINISLLVFLISFACLNSVLATTFLNRENKINKFTRIHVVANSNSIKDQILKLKVYENIKSYIDSYNYNSNSNLEAFDFLKSHNNDLLNISNSTLTENSAPYSASIFTGKLKYDEKQSIILDMPEGTYNSIKIVLGKGEGKNIWGVLFPNEKNIKMLEPLETILPGISSIYEETDEKEKNTYSFKILEKLKNL